MQKHKQKVSSQTSVRKEFFPPSPLVICQFWVLCVFFLLLPPDLPYEQLNKSTSNIIQCFVSFVLLKQPADGTVGPIERHLGGAAVGRASSASPIDRKTGKRLGKVKVAVRKLFPPYVTLHDMLCTSYRQIGSDMVLKMKK